MGLLTFLRDGHWSTVTETAATQAVTEAADGGPSNVVRTGFEFGIPASGTNTPDRARAAASQRTQVMDELFQAYLACPWVSTCVDAIARMVTAGGLELVPVDETADVDQRPPAVQAIDRLMRFVNDREDMIQLLRSTVTDLLVFGDGFLEQAMLATLPVALWTLDATTVSIAADPHGKITGYVQQVDSQRTATFNPSEVIHVSLDSPRGGLYGVSPVQKLMLPITAWLFVEACIKENFRRGNPADIAVDLTKGMSDTEVERWRQQYQANNLGPRSIGMPIVTRVHPMTAPGAPPIHELQPRKVEEMLLAANQLRDEIISGFGLAPAMVGVIESGNLGGGTGESQAKAVHYQTVLPLQNLLIEKLNYALLERAGIVGWTFKFGEVDYRDSKVVEDIRDARLRNGSWTLNRYRADIGEDPVEGGDKPVLVERQSIMLWSDVPAFSQAQIDNLEAKAEPDAPDPGAPEPSAAQQVVPPEVGKKAAPQQEAARQAAALQESWRRAYLAQRKAALRDLPGVDEAVHAE